MPVQFTVGLCNSLIFLVLDNKKSSNLFLLITLTLNILFKEGDCVRLALKIGFTGSAVQRVSQKAGSQQPITKYQLHFY